MPKRVVPRFADLTPEEATNIWLTAQRIGRKIEPHFGATSLTFAIQDGPQAGQTVSHIHIHILPRKGGDFAKNDDIYDAMDENEKVIVAAKKDMDLDKPVKPRTKEEMAAEALELRKLFVD
eukprot:jgi/Mesen1/7887/ME000420S07032